MLVLAVAVHFASAAPSDSHTVAKRRVELATTLDEVSSIGRALVAENTTTNGGGGRAGGANGGAHEQQQQCRRRRRRRVVVVLGGDFNALREEFVHGNGAAFFACPAVARTRPAFRRPEPGTEVTADTFGARPRGRLVRAECCSSPSSPPPPSSSQDHYAFLELFCDGADGGGVLREASQPDRNMDVGCTRAGKSVVIDFLFVGSFGCSGSGSGGDAVAVAADTARPRDVVSPEQAAAAADEKSGIYANVLEFGSDHLPVACDFLLP